MAPSPRSRLGGPPPLLVDDVAVDQPGHGAHTGAMADPAVPVSLAERLEAAQPPDAVFDDHALAGEGLVVGHILRRALFAPRLTARGGAALMHGGDPHIAQ